MKDMKIMYEISRRDAEDPDLPPPLDQSSS